MESARKEAQSLLDVAQHAELDADMLEIEDHHTGEVNAVDTSVSSAVLNPLNTTDTARPRYVGYMPMKLGRAPEVYWALVDTGAQVSVISAGLAAYTDLYAPDGSNVFPASFAVSGYNGTKSYMPVLQAPVRLGARGGAERELEMHLCILDTNTYKFIVGVDLLHQLNFIYDDPGRRLHLTHHGVQFSLPLATREYAMNAPAIRAYNLAAGQVTDTPQIAEVGLFDLATNELEELEDEMASAVL